jgi:hypothetical protein
MRPHHASASATERLLGCPWSMHPDRVYEDTSSEAAQDGTDNHGVLAIAAAGGVAPEWASAAVLDVPPEAWVERSGALNVDTGAGRWLDTKGRDYADIRPEEIPFTLDVAWIEAGTLTVRDWKTGPQAQEHTTAARDNPQLATMALAVLGLTDEPVHAVRLQLGFVGPGRELELDEHETTPEGLRARWLMPLSGALDAITADEELAPKPGPHCNWCPCIAECPAARTQLAVVERQSSLAEDAILTTAIASPEHAASVYARLGMAQDLLDRIGGALKEYVRDHGPVPMGNGKVLRVIESSRETCALAKVSDALKEQLRASGAVSVSMYDQMRVGSAEPKKRAKKEKTP